MSEQDPEASQTTTSKKRKKKIEFLRVRLPPMSSTLKKQSPLENKDDLVYIGVREQSLKPTEQVEEPEHEIEPEPEIEKEEIIESKQEIKSEQKEEPTQKIELHQKAINKEIQKTSKKKRQIKVKPKSKKKIKDQVKKGTIAPTKKSMGFKFFLSFIFIIFLFLTTGYFSSQYLYKEPQTNLFGLKITKDNEKIPDTYQLNGIQNLELKIQNTNNYPIKIYYITWGPDSAEKYQVTWDYKGVPIPPGGAYDVHICVERITPQTEESLLNINFLALKS